MVIKATIRTDGLAKLAMRLRSIRPTLTPGQWLAEVGQDSMDEFVNVMAQAFKTEGASGASGKWAALSDNPPGHGYASQKLAKYGNQPILVATGALRDSLTKPRHKNMIFQVDANGILLGSTIPYFKYHQLGTTKMPKRPPISLTKDQIQRIAIQPFKKKIGGQP